MIVLVTVLMVSGFAVAGLAGVLGAHASSVAPVPTAASVPASHAASASAVRENTATNAKNIGASMASAALAATKAAGLKPNVVFVPRPSATAAQRAEAGASGHVTPLYTGSPAPMGLGYYGLSSGPGGQVVPTILNTTSVEATVAMNYTGVQANDLFQSSPDSYGIQLNAVVTNVTLFGTGGYSFWTQNVIEYYPQTDVMALITNVWNFSGGPLSANVFYTHGPWGTQVGTEYYYAEYGFGLIGPIAYPFDITLYENSTVSGGRNNVSFNVGLSGPSFPVGGIYLPYDYVVFNSIAAGHPSVVTAPSNYTANGYQYNPIGLTDDFELIFGGPGGGSQSTLFDADATLGLAYLDGGSYVSVPAAFNYGGETGETVTGASIGWSNAAGGPFSTYGTMTTGPSLMGGLWNATGPQGTYPVTLAVTPANAFNILGPVIGPGNFSQNFTVNEPGIAPEAFTNTLYLAPGNYTLLTELSGYDPVSSILDVTGPTTVTLSLVADPATGVYTPLWAFNDGEVAALAVSGLGTAGSPYIMPNTQALPLSSVFGLYNDYTFPVYPGVFFMNTDVTTEFVSPPSFNTTTNTFAFPGQYLPSYNDLQYWFWNVYHVGVLNAANISGWFGQSSWYPSVFDTFNVIFYQGGNNLVAGNTFNSEGQGLLVFSGGTFFGPLNVGGGNNTIWGNVFNQVLAPGCPTASCETIISPVLGLGLELAAPNTLIYNNEFLTPTTAWELPINLYSGIAEFFSGNAWNIAPVPGSVVNFAAGFPAYPLTGVITGPNSYVNGVWNHKGWQGGNYWWDYGLTLNPYNGADNPYGVLPYDENSVTFIAQLYPPTYYSATWIYPGGDFEPLTFATLWPITFCESGLPAGDSWDVNVGFAGTPMQSFTTTAACYTVYLPNSFGYNFNVSAPYGYTATPSSATNLNVNNHAGVVKIVFTKTSFTVTFTESGLSAKQLASGWTVTLNGTTKTVHGVSVTFTGVLNWTNIPYVVAGPKGEVVSGSGIGTVTVAGKNVTVPVKFVAGTSYTLTFSMKGLAKNTNWCVVVDGWSQCTKTGSIKFSYLTTGTYTFTVPTVAGYTVTPSSGSVTLTKNTSVPLKAKAIVGA